MLPPIDTDYFEESHLKFNNKDDTGYGIRETEKTKMSGTEVVVHSTISVTPAECFDIARVSGLFQMSLLEADDVQLDSYLSAYEEIMKFFQLMGSVFSYVSSDVRTKMDLLYTLRASDCDDQQHFNTFKTMLEYEKDTDLLNQKGYVSGSRTLLRLHRGLGFVYEFLVRLQELPDEQKTVDVCKEAYDMTLGKHHSFIIRRGAKLAMYAMPTKGDLMKRVCTDVHIATENLPDMLQYMRNNYDRTEELYTLHHLHNLP